MSHIIVRLLARKSDRLGRGEGVGSGGVGRGQLGGQFTREVWRCIVCVYCVYYVFMCGICVCGVNVVCVYLCVLCGIIYIYIYVCVYV